MLGCFFCGELCEEEYCEGEEYCALCGLCELCEVCEVCGSCSDSCELFNPLKPSEFDSNGARKSFCLDEDFFAGEAATEAEEKEAEVVVEEEAIGGFAEVIEDVRGSLSDKEEDEEERLGEMAEAPPRMICKNDRDKREAHQEKEGEKEKEK